jgi:hypothetical protein
MRARSDSRPTQQAARKPLRYVLAVAVVLMGLFVLYVNRSPAPAPEVAPVDLETEQPPTLPEGLPQPSAPDIPRVLEPEPAAVVESSTEAQPLAPEPAVPALPALLESDVAVREALMPVSDAAPVRDFLGQEMLLQRAVALIDGVSRGFLPARVAPLPRPTAPFVATVIEGQPHLDAAGYARYDRVVRWVEGVDVEMLARAFHRFRPLLEEAYAELGYASEDMDNALIRALDRVLDTPRIETPIPLRRDSVMYTFADPELESRTSLQKHLLRVGPENLARIQAIAASLRAALLADDVQ